jgi:dTDP-4-dehydrorhamnose 3,5-epimerase
MRTAVTDIPDVLIIEPRVFTDERGLFCESYSSRRFEELIGRRVEFVQDNWSRSRKNVLRGLHYQIRQTQAKLVRVVSGVVFDVAVDLRRSSPTFGRWTAVTLSADDHNALWIPEGFAHGFVVLSDSADVAYKASDYYAPQHERTIRWDDGDIGISWPVTEGLTISPKDLAGVSLRNAELFP